MNIAAIIISIIVMSFGFAGGGGSSSGGGGGSSSSSSSHSSYSSSSGSSGDSGSPEEAFGAFIAFLCICVVFCVGFYISEKRNKALNKDNNDTTHEKNIHVLAEDIFKRYQADWSSFSYKDIARFTTPRYHAHAVLMLQLLEEMHRVNKVSNLKIREIRLLDPVPEDSKFPLKLRIRYYFDGLDEVYDEKSGNRLYHFSARNINETWNYIYDGQELKLDGISQPTESAPHLVKSLAVFAEENHLFYSPDWGRYCLPARGLIFNHISMQQADINNHIIGRWVSPQNAAPNPVNPVKASAYSSSGQNSEKSKDTAYVSSGETAEIGAASGPGLLIQLYTYAPSPDQTVSSYYIVGQINVPKSYLGVVVKSKKFKTRLRPDKSYEKYELEWGDFNKRYDVYAASRDALPAFELLDPTFMEFLYSKNPAYNLEVADDIIYIYANIRTVSEKDYKDLLDTLHEAHKRLKM